jgi:hypothetical protein
VFDGITMIVSVADPPEFVHVIERVVCCVRPTKEPLPPDTDLAPFQLGRDGLDVATQLVGLLPVVQVTIGGLLGFGSGVIPIVTVGELPVIVTVLVGVGFGFEHHLVNCGSGLF